MTQRSDAASEETAALLGIYDAVGRMDGFEILAPNYRPMPLEDAIRVLVEAPPNEANRQSRLDALHELHATGKLATVRPDLAVGLARSALPAERQDDPAAAERLLASIQSTQPGGSGGNFDTIDKGLLGAADQHAPIPICDPVVVDVNGVKATRIWARYHSDLPVSAFGPGADPLLWPSCNPFFISMEVQGQKKPLPAPDVGYEALVLETVGYPDIGFELKTYLNVNYSAQPDRVAMTFAFVESADGEIDVDSGYMLAFPDSNRPGQTVVESLKLVHFTKLTNRLAPFACKLGWVHTMMNMADCGSKSQAVGSTSDESGGEIDD